MTTRSGLDAVSIEDQDRFGKRIEARLAQIRSQLEKCRRSHGPMCTSQVMPVSQGSDIILIDVDAMRLVRTTTNVRYLALSYVWGGVEQFYASKANISALMEDGALQGHLDQIPTVIRHSMEFVRGLKIRFLWVDALCIIQDDLTHKHSQIAQMAAIYSQSFLTIVAAEAKDATSHLAVLNPYPRTLGRSSFLGARSRCEQLVNRLLNSTYGSRGWTFQERVLSPRILYDFSDHALLQCPSGLWLMDSVSRWQNVRGYSESFKQLSPLADSANSSGHPFTSNSGRLDESTFATYALLTTEYTKKRLTFESDIQLAFSGIADALSQRHRPPLSFLYGLPERYLQYALLWHSTTLARRREVEGVPSWSWMAWVGPVGFFYHPLGSFAMAMLGTCPLPCIGPVEICWQSETRSVQMGLQRKPLVWKAPTLGPRKDTGLSSPELPWPQGNMWPVLQFRASCIPFKATFTYEDAMIAPPGTLTRIGMEGYRRCPGLKLLFGKGHCVGWIMGLSSEMLSQYEGDAWRLDIVLVSECGAYCNLEMLWSVSPGAMLLNFLLIKTRHGSMFSERLAAGRMKDEVCRKRKPRQRDIYLQ